MTAQSPGHIVTAAEWNLIWYPPQVKVSLSANLSVANATTTAVPFTVEAWDTDTMHSTSVNTSRLTVVTAGRYEMHASVLWAVSAAGVRLLTIRKNGTTNYAYIGEDAGTAALGGFNVGMQAHLTDTAIVGDYYEITVYQSSGGALNLLTDPCTWFQARLVTP